MIKLNETSNKTKNTINKKKSKRNQATIEVSSSHIVHSQSKHLDQKVIRHTKSINSELHHLTKQQKFIFISLTNLINKLARRGEIKIEIQ